MNNVVEERIYKRTDCVIFRMTKESFGALSNMASGYSLDVNGINAPSSEALYQSCRYPFNTAAQMEILREASAMTAKMKSKKYRKETRADWEEVKVKIMRWCLRIKLAQHWQSFGQLLISTGEHAIVEESKRDNYWGAKAIDGEILIGKNVLGRLLMELREIAAKGFGTELQLIYPPGVVDFLLLGEPVHPIIQTGEEKAFRLRMG